MAKKMDLILETLQSHESLLHQLIKSVAATNVKVNEIDKKLEKNTTDIEEINSSLVTRGDFPLLNFKASYIFCVSAVHDRSHVFIQFPAMFDGSKNNLPPPPGIFGQTMHSSHRYPRGMEFLL